MKIIRLVLAVVITGMLSISSAHAQTSSYKCMIQMTNYTGEGAYIVVSIINKDGGYDKTLSVMGPDRKWYNTLTEWDNANKKKPAKIDGITGASVAGGARSVVVLEIENAKINAGYKLRFESAVEDKPYYAKDLEIPLTTEALAAKSEGTGYIRYARFSAD